LPADPILAAAPAPAPAPVPAAGARVATVCFTGFRDKELDKRMVAKGFTIAASMTKKVEILLVPDNEEPTGAKVDTARAAGIPVMRKSEFVNEYHV